MQGALASLHALVLIAAPPLYGAIFSRFTGEQALMELPGMVFVLPFALCLLALGLLRGRRGEG